MSTVVTPDAGSVSQASRAWRVPAAIRLPWLHLLSHRVPSALVALLGCGVVLWAALADHWWYGTGHAADELPTLLEGCAAAIIAVTTHSSMGEPERATGRWLPYLRLGLALVLCGAAIGFLAAGAALAYNPKGGVVLADGMLAVTRNVLGFTAVGLIFSLVIGGLLSWIGPLGYVALCQFAAIANYSEPLTWASRPPGDRGGWVAATMVFAVALAGFTIRGPRVRPSGELAGRVRRRVGNRLDGVSHMRLGPTKRMGRHTAPNQRREVKFRGIRWPFGGRESLCTVAGSRCPKIPDGRAKVAQPGTERWRQAHDTGGMVRCRLTAGAAEGGAGGGGRGGHAGRPGSRRSARGARASG